MGHGSAPAAGATGAEPRGPRPQTGPSWAGGAEVAARGRSWRLSVRGGPPPRPGMITRVPPPRRLPPAGHNPGTQPKPCLPDTHRGSRSLVAAASPPPPSGSPMRRASWKGASPRPHRVPPCPGEGSRGGVGGGMQPGPGWTQETVTCGSSKPGRPGLPPCPVPATLLSPEKRCGSDSCKRGSREPRTY